MMRSRSIQVGITQLLALSLTFLVFCPVHTASAQASSADEAAQLKQEIQSLKRDYEQRILQLEERLRRLETNTVPTQTNVVMAPQATAAAQMSTNSTVKARQFAEKEFQRDTESRERALISETHPFAGRVEQVLQDFMEIHGYFRAGYGRDGEGGPQTAFQAPGAFSKYRLGNEAENYGEITLGKNFYVPGQFKLGNAQNGSDVPPGPVARVQTTIGIYNPYQDLLSSSGTEFSLPEAFASIGNVVGTQPSMKFWAGSRYYRRHDIHISDFFFYNLSGTGGGVEDIATALRKTGFRLDWRRFQQRFQRPA